MTNGLFNTWWLDIINIIGNDINMVMSPDKFTESNPFQLEFGQKDGSTNLANNNQNIWTGTTPRDSVLLPYIEYTFRPGPTFVSEDD